MKTYFKKVLLLVAVAGSISLYACRETDRNENNTEDVPMNDEMNGNMDGNDTLTKNPPR